MRVSVHALPEQLVESDREVAHTNAGGVVPRVATRIGPPMVRTLAAGERGERREPRLTGLSVMTA